MDCGQYVIISGVQNKMYTFSDSLIKLTSTKLAIPHTPLHVHIWQFTKHNILFEKTCEPMLYSGIYGR